MANSNLGLLSGLLHVFNAILECGYLLGILGLMGMWDLSYD